MKFSISTVILVSLSYSNAFHSSRITVPRATHLYSSADADDGNLLNGLKAGFNIFRKGITAGDGLKQSLADALAGPDLDLAVANDRIDAYIKSAPVVVFSWTVSVFSTKAKNYLTSIGATFESVELDQPWSDGNPIRSALGRRVGRTSVPAIFINGVYIGGCEDGPGGDAPGLVPLAFQGKLRPLLLAAGALKLDPTVDLQSAGVKQQVVDTAGVDVSSSSVAKRSFAPMASEHEYVVSTTVTANQKSSTPSDLFVSSTVAANMLKALQPATPTKVVPVVTTSAPVTAAVVAAPAAAVAATVAVTAAPPAKKSGFYRKPSSDDELCPVEEECEL